MIKSDMWHEIHSRRRLKETKKSIARALGLHIQTIRKVLRQAAPQPYEREKDGQGILSSYRDYILQRLAAVGYGDLPPLNRSRHNERNLGERSFNGQGTVHFGTDHRSASGS